MFEIEQTYDLAALTALCRVARKTVRKWTRILHTVIWVIFALGTALVLYELAYQAFEPDDWPLPVMLALLLALLLFEDKLNGWIALRNLVPGTAHSTTVFADDAYTVTTDVTVTRWGYENITSLCETERYYFFFLGKKHGQCFDKQGFRVGGSEAFRAFIEQKTGKSFERTNG